jgi:hypothetical protein
MAWSWRVLEVMLTPYSLVLVNEPLNRSFRDRMVAVPFSVRLPKNQGRIVNLSVTAFFKSMEMRQD